MLEKLQSALDREIITYIARNPRSQALFERAKLSLPGGNTRTGAHMEPFPLYADSGEGVYLIDLDGHRLLDFVNNNTSLMLGHAHPAVVAALQKQIGRGTGFHRPLALEVEMAELLRERIPSLERLRFCSSGSEAVLNALRAAKAFTGKPKIAKFEGAYHGVGEYITVSHLPPLSADLGPADAPRGVPSSAGTSPSVLDEVIILPFNDVAACQRLIEAHKAELAAVIVDPLSTGAGMTLPVDDFLTHLRRITTEADVLLIFDEIISFRAARGGSQELYGVRPDLTCLAKVIAGGTPAGAFGGRADIMALFDPTTDGPYGGAQIQQSGTYNANPLSMVAGMATLQQLTPEVYARLDTLTKRLGAGLDAVFEEAGIPAQVTTVGSLFRVHFLPQRPRNYREAAQDNGKLHRWLQLRLLNHDIMWSTAGNVSVPMGEGEVDRFVGAVAEALGEVG